MYTTNYRIVKVNLEKSNEEKKKKKKREVGDEPWEQIPNVTQQFAREGLQAQFLAKASWNY